MTLKDYYKDGVLKRKLLKDYHYTLEVDNTLFYVLLLPVTRNSILTINSKYMWEIKYGKIDGARFHTSNKKLLKLSAFQSRKNKIIVFKGKPYKIYKHINESDVIDVSDQEEIFGIRLFDSIK